MSKPRIFNGDNGISFSYLKREDGRWVVTRMFGGSIIVLRVFGNESSARKDAANEAMLARLKRTA